VDHARSDHVTIDQERSDHVMSDHVKKDHEKSDHVMSDHATIDQERSALAKKDQEKKDREMSDPEMTVLVKSVRERSVQERSVRENNKEGSKEGMTDLARMHLTVVPTHAEIVLTDRKCKTDRLVKSGMIGVQDLLKTIDVHRNIARNALRPTFSAMLMTTLLLVRTSFRVLNQ
jgi:hypothetical protein